ALAADAIDRGRTGARPDAHHLIQTRAADPRGRNRDLVQTFDAAPELLLRAHNDVVLIFARVERRGVLSRAERMERLIDIHHADTEIGGARPVDFKADFWLAGT